MSLHHDLRRIDDYTQRYPFKPTKTRPENDGQLSLHEIKPGLRVVRHNKNYGPSKPLTILGHPFVDDRGYWKVRVEEYGREKDAHLSDMGVVPYPSGWNNVNHIALAPEPVIEEKIIRYTGGKIPNLGLQTLAADGWSLAGFLELVGGDVDYYFEREDPAAPQPAVETKVIPISPTGIAPERLKALANEGWRLTSTWTLTDGFVDLHFERKVPVNG